MKHSIPVNATTRQALDEIMKSINELQNQISNLAKKLEDYKKAP